MDRGKLVLPDDFTEGMFEFLEKIVTKPDKIQKDIQKKSHDVKIKIN